MAKQVLKIFYGYIIALSAFFIVLVGWGTFFSFGVFFEPVLKEFGWTRAETSGAYSFATLIVGFTAIGMGRLNDQFGPRIVLTLCGLFAGVGYFLISLISEIWQLYLFYGIMVGVGVGGFYVPPTSTVVKWFIKRRTLMTGIVLLGTSLGVIIIPTLATWLISRYGWRFAYMAVGSINIIVVIAAAQLLKSDPGKVGRLPYGVAQESGHKGRLQPRDFLLREAIQVKEFWLLCIIFFCFFFVINAILSHIIIHATGKGMTPASAATIMVAFGGAGIVGRIIIGILGDSMGNKRACLICFLLMSFDIIYLLTATDLREFQVFGGILGFAFAGIGALIGPLTADFFGLKSHGLILGMIYASDMVGGAIGPVLTGKIFDVTGSYDIAFISCAVVGFAGSLFVCLLGYHGAPRAEPVVPPCSSAESAEAYPPAHKASEGYPPVAKSTGASSLEHMDNIATFYAFIVRRHRLWPTASTAIGRACTPECHDQLFALY